ncbi:uncharacterized protein [Leptinotarsa decemlineata]|uniref:uncharacterized protein n=1 Tax=Leptinotarsa decemlineata TaxID=7539 RepID=UPI003D307DED
MNTLILIKFLLLSLAFGAYVLPDDFKICRGEGQKLNKCILSAIRDAWPKLADPGISSPITIKTEPLFSPYCEYHINNDVFIFDEYFWNLSHTGFINSKILSASVDVSNLALNFTTFTPHVVQKSTYVGYGTLLYNKTRAPEAIWGFGPSVKDLYNLTILHQLKSVKVEEQGETYLDIVSYHVSASLDFITFDYQNLYNGTNPEKAKRAGGYVNATAVYTTANRKPYVEGFFAEMFKTYAKRIIGSVPLCKLLPSFL